MGRTVYWMNVSIDGYIERAAGEHGADGLEAAPGWSRIDQQLTSTSTSRHVAWR